MTKKYVTDVNRWITREELVNEIRSKKIEAKILKRLLFIKYLYDGDSVPEASKKVEISSNTGYSWRRGWNEEGYRGLIPRYSGGRPPELSIKQKDDLRVMLEKRDDWTTKEVRELIQNEFEVVHTERHVRRLLRSMGMKHGKPYPHDYRQPENAEEILKKT